MSSTLPPDVWPAPLAHCAKPLVDPTDDRVTIAEISSDPVNGFKGTRMLYTALVPVEDLHAVMTTIEGLGQGVSTGPGGRAFSPDGTHAPAFWVYGLKSTKRFESLINTWDNHNKEIILPDNDFLMNFNLMPRAIGDDTAWDDLNEPRRDVVMSTPVSSFKIVEGYTNARITVLREYLDRYLIQKNCAAIATFWDERYSTDDPEVAALIAAKKFSFKQRGRELWIKPLRGLEFNQVSQVWGSAILLKPSGPPASRRMKPALRWPDFPNPIKVSELGRLPPLQTVFVKDEALIKYEDKPEYEIHPIRGSVGYESRWRVSYCHRVGRNHIELELRKIYEGAPDDVIEHFNKFAVPKAVAEKDEQQNGKRNVGIRAKEFIDSYLELAATLSKLAAALSVPSTQEAICKLDSVKINHSGWWTFPELTPLGNVMPVGMTRTAFLNSCKNVFSVIENLQEAPLRKTAIQLGLDNVAIKDFRSVRLFVAICQLAQLGKDAGFNLVKDSATITSLWLPTSPFSKDVEALFAVRDLRVTGAHNLGPKKHKEFVKPLGIFGINENQCASGWGIAMDKVYDRLIVSLRSLNTLLTAAW
jgi:hypothetical protein